MSQIAIENGWFDPNVGMHMRDNGKLLGCFNVKYSHTQHGRFEDLKSAIDNGSHVMVNINRIKLIGKDTPYPDATHAVLVIGCEYKTVSIADPADNMNTKTYPISDFIRAWSDSLNYILIAYTTQNNFQTKV